MLYFIINASLRSAQDENSSGINRFCGKLRIAIDSAQDLVPVSKWNNNMKCDPLVRVWLSDGKGARNYIGRTRTVKDDLNPQFQKAHFDAAQSSSKSNNLKQWLLARSKITKSGVRDAGEFLYFVVAGRSLLTHSLTHPLTHSLTARRSAAQRNVFLEARQQSDRLALLEISDFARFGERGEVSERALRDETAISTTELTHSIRIRLARLARSAQHTCESNPLGQLHIKIGVRCPAQRSDWRHPFG